MRIMKYLIALAIAVIFSACTSMKSIKNPEHTDDKDGLSYFLPKKDILIQFSVKQPSPPKSDSSSTKKDTSNKKSNSNGSGSAVKITEVTIGATSAYPDFSEQYIINYSTNLIGQNTLNIGVNKLGLLTSAKSETESKINESFKALAKAFGMAGGVLFTTPIDTDKKECDDIGDYTFIYPVPDDSSLEINKKNYSDFTPPTQDSEALTADACGYEIEITRLLNKDQKSKLITHGKNDNKLHSGIFYRQEIPYRVTVKKGPYSHATIVSSPSASNPLFLPIKGTLFADNKADFSFSDGIPTMNKQVVGSELLALAQLPADIIEGYFEGVGALFKHISGVKEAQSGNIKHEFEALRYELCIAAINANNTNLITELQCTAK